MSGGFTVDRAALEDFSARLRAGRQRLESIADSVPPSPDGGDGGPLIVDLLAHLVADAGRLSSELVVAADQIDRSSEDYRAADLASESAFRSLAGLV